jgi:hypothetical protein
LQHVPHLLADFSSLLPVAAQQDREQSAKFGAPPSIGARAMMAGGGGFGGGGFGGMGGNKLYIGNVSARQPFRLLAVELLC